MADILGKQTPNLGVCERYRTYVVKEIDWPRLKTPNDRGGVWKTLSPNKEQVQWICFLTWAKVTAAWSCGFGKPCLMVSKDADPTHIWRKLCK